MTSYFVVSFFSILEHSERENIQAYQPGEASLAGLLSRVLSDPSQIALQASTRKFVCQLVSEINSLSKNNKSAVEYRRALHQLKLGKVEAIAAEWSSVLQKLQAEDPRHIIGEYYGYWSCTGSGTFRNVRHVASFKI